MQRSYGIRLYFAISVVALTSSAIAYYFLFPSTLQTSSEPRLVARPGTPDSILLSSQSKTFYANGQYWLFYDNGSSVLYTKTRDATSWSSPSVIGMGVSSGSGFALYYSSGVLSYVCVSSDGLTFSNGTLGSSGVFIFTNYEVRLAGSPLYERSIPSLAADTQGRFWSAWASGPNKVTVERSLDTLGDSWMNMGNFTFPAGYVNLLQIISLGANGMYLLVQLENNTDIGSTFWYEGFAYGPRGWSNLEMVTPKINVLGFPNLQFDGEDGMAVADSTGKLYFAYSTTNNSRFSYLLTSRPNDGQWTSPSTIDTIPENAPNQVPYVAVSINNADDKLLFAYGIEHDVTMKIRTMPLQSSSLIPPTLIRLSGSLETGSGLYSASFVPSIVISQTALNNKFVLAFQTTETGFPIYSTLLSA
jgi:hypothetical protein